MFKSSEIVEKIYTLHLKHCVSKNKPKTADYQGGRGVDELGAWRKNDRLIPWHSFTVAKPDSELI